jgi:aminopeptidase S
LVTTDGTAFRVKTSSNDSADNLVTTYQVNASGEIANGVWKLRVQDAAARDTRPDQQLVTPVLTGTPQV